MSSTLPASVRRLIWQVWYEYVARLIGQAEYDFLNFGYVPGPGEHAIDLDEQDQPDRPFIELYSKVIGSVEMAGARVLEVSCGRGGGAAFVAKYRKPDQYVAMDRAAASIEYCRSRHSNPLLRFVLGDAENLDLPPESFDAVINIEASHAYGSRTRFFGEVYRTLAPQGRLLTADFCPADDLADWKRAIEGVGFEVREQEDITKGVLQSLRKTHRIRMQAIRDLTPGWLFPLFRNFTGAQGSRIVRDMKRGRVVYMRFAAVKSPGS